jgi:hypothetical protein
MAREYLLSYSTVIAEGIQGHAERNRELRGQLLSKDVSLDEPRPVEFHFWAFTHRDASVLARSLFEMGFLLTLLVPAPTDSEPERWSIEAGAHVPLSDALGSDLTAKLVRLAAREGALFDGWGTNV